MSDTEPSTRITLSTIYGLLLETKTIVTPLPEKVNDHEIRIRAIEKYLWVWIGASGVTGAGIGQLLTTIIGSN